VVWTHAASRDLYFVEQMKTNKGPQLVRRKSELPQDLYTAKALATYKRPEDHLTTNPENS